jgi:hypothetical protein
MTESGRKPNLAGLLGPLGLARRTGTGRGVHGRGPLEVADLLLQRVNLALLVRRDGRTLGTLGRGRGAPRLRELGRGRAVLSGRFVLVFVQALHFPLQDAHGLAE